MIWEVFFLILGIPVGFLIAWLGRDELIQGRKWFKAIVWVSIILGIIFIILERFYISWTMGFIMIVSGISLWKSYDKKWIKIRR